MTFRPNAAGFAALEESTRHAEDAWAEAIGKRARELAPVATGAYRDSIRAERQGEAAGVVADVPYAVYVEFGTSDTPAFAPLTTATQMSAHDLPTIFGAAAK